MKKERYWVCRACPWWGHRKMHEKTEHCPKCGRAMTKARKYPQALSMRYHKGLAKQRKIERRESARAFDRYQVVRGAGKRPGGKAIRVSLRTRKAYHAMFQAKDKWSRGRAAERLFKSFGKDIGATDAVTLNWVDTAIPGEGTLGVYHHRGAITLAHNQPQPDMRDTVNHEMTHWADRVAGISANKLAGSHTRLFYIRVAWLRAEIER